jgi:uncharacterized membrane protein
MAEGNKNFFDTPDTTSEYEAQDIQDNKVMGILAYIGILVLVPIFAAKNSRYARFHANQGLVLLICGAAVIITLSILGIIPYVGIVFRIISILAELAFAGLVVFGIVHVAKGRAKELPLIGKFRILK